MEREGLEGDELAREILEMEVLKVFFADFLFHIENDGGGGGTHSGPFCGLIGLLKPKRGVKGLYLGQNPV